jgi:hypothetical protein
MKIRRKSCGVKCSVAAQARQLLAGMFEVASDQRPGPAAPDQGAGTQCHCADGGGKS